ncbi:nucleotide pyrophosphohydrolase [Haliea sp. E17]|uniref:nucleotide pyrophosphohydrolase n=1 Tax=Haliea sp. E17 TaxID=3401576 RepID=UPI003AADAE82
MVEDIAKELRRFASERDWEQFHSPKNIVMALGVEAAELMEIFQWLSEEQSFSLSDEQRRQVEEEAGDVLNYLIRLCDLLNIDLLQAARDKIKVNAEKYPVDQAKGKALKYTQLGKDDDA